MKEFPGQLGTEAAGVVEATGAHVSALEGAGGGCRTRRRTER
ncbi:hypothetical protein [Streptomyces agglomeratus]|nr:hypothetical protein [Streptomyces agglomeratus]